MYVCLYKRVRKSPFNFPPLSLSLFLSFSLSLSIYIYIYIYWKIEINSTVRKCHHHHHHHHVVLVARISLTLSRHFSLSFIASGRSSGQHPVSSHGCWMYVRAGRPDFARPCVDSHTWPCTRKCTNIKNTWY